MLKYAIGLHVYVAFGFFKWLKSQHNSLKKIIHSRWQDDWS